MFDALILWVLAILAIVVGLAALIYAFFQAGRSRW